jgi:ABC-2 type transport system permease protein
VSRRALSTPIGPGTFLTGIGGSRFALALLQAGLLLLVGALWFGISWGSLPATLALTVVYCLVATGAGMLLGAVARTADQAIAIGVPLAIGTAMLGGTMWPLDVVGPVMQVVGHLMPQSWAMDAWTAIVNEGAGVDDVALELAVLSGYAAAFLVVGTWALRRTLTR